MTASLAHRLAILVVTAALLACGARAQCPPPVYAEYSLDASEHPESIDCFYECLRAKSEASKKVCFARCEGVVAAMTESPCSEDAGALCRSFKEPESCPSDSEDQAGEVVGEILGFAIRSGIEGASDDDDDDDQKQRKSEAPSRRRASPTPSKSPSKSWSKASRKETLPPSSFGSKLKKR